MKANFKQEQEEIVENETEEFVDTEYEDFIRAQEEKRKPFQELIDYLEADPNLSLHFTGDDGKQKDKVLDVDTLLNWEENNTNIYMSKVGVESGQVYVWRTLRRFEYLKILSGASQEATVNWNDDKQRQEFIIKKCLLFPNPSIYFRNKSEAGVIPTLEKQILYQSGFIPDQEAFSTISVIG